MEASETSNGTTLRNAFGNVLSFFILILIGVLAFSIRLFSVIKYESVIHEFDPYFNYRVTQFLTKNGIYDFWNWFDDRTWYPLGRVIGGTVYPGLTLTAGTLWWLLNSLNIPLSVETICVFTAPIFSAFTSWATYLLTREVKGSGAGLTAAALMAMVPSYISRSVAGSYDNEAVAIFALIFTFYLYIKIAFEDSVDSEDGGKSIIQEMPPYEAEAVMADLAKAWIRTRVDRLKEWVDRNLQQEVWNPQANIERFAPSAIEVLRIIDETLEAFFMLPIPMHPGLIPELKTGLDRCLQYYVSKAKTGCGTQITFIPTMPALTRCSAGSKFHGVFKKERSHINQRRKSQERSLTMLSCTQRIERCSFGGW